MTPDEKDNQETTPMVLDPQGNPGDPQVDTPEMGASRMERRHGISTMDKLSEIFNKGKHVQR